MSSTTGRGTWRSIGRYQLAPDVRVIVQVGDRDQSTPDDTVDQLEETATTLLRLSRLLRRRQKASA